MSSRKVEEIDSLQVWTVAQLGTFYTEYRSEFIAHANRQLKNNAKAEEVVQEALIKVMLAAPELSSQDHARSYIHRTIENLCFDIFRLEGRRPNLVLLDDATTELDSLWQQNLDHSEVIAAADDAAIVRQALSMLSPSERTALIMWEMEGRTTKEIAKELGIKESTVRHTVSRARSSLRKILSELIIDSERGLTALDLLSTTYKKTSDFARKSSKAALSVILVIFAFLGFNNMPNHENVTTLDFLSYSPKNLVSKHEDLISENFNSPSPTISPENKKSNQLTTISAKPSVLNFPGLDKDGLPTGFTVSDSLGNLGVLFVTKSSPKSTEDGINLSFISKTKSGALNIFLSQDISVDGNGTTYKTGISAGIKGNWVPLNLSQTTVDIERLASGNYLVTATMMVDSAVETPITVPSSTTGTDLISAPKSVKTRLLLSASKTQVLAQAVLVNESSKAGKA